MKRISIILSILAATTVIQAEPPILRADHPKLVKAKQDWKNSDKGKAQKRFKKHLEALGVTPESVGETTPPLELMFFDPVSGQRIFETDNEEWGIGSPFTGMIAGACGGRDCVGLHVCQIYYPPLGQGPRVEYDVYADPTMPGIVNITQWERIQKAPGGEVTPLMIQNPANFVSSPYVGTGAVDCWGFPAGTLDAVQIGFRLINFTDTDPLEGVAGNGKQNSRDGEP